MIHPFRDGNARMARALQTLVLARDAVVEPTFSSIEEWLGNNTEDYYRVLAATGEGSWQPENDTRTWLKSGRSCPLALAGRGWTTWGRPVNPRGCRLRRGCPARPELKMMDSAYPRLPRPSVLTLRV